MRHTRSRFNPPPGLTPPPPAKSKTDCPYCGQDLRGCPPDDSGLVTCPSCQNPTLDPFAKRTVGHLPSCRCENCGYELSGLGGASGGMTKCPECSAAFPAAWFSQLEHFPGYAAAIRRMFKVTPYILGVFAVLCILVWASGRGSGGVTGFVIVAAVCAVLSAGEAIMKAKEIAWVSVGRRDKLELFALLTGIGFGLSLALWLPMGAIVILLSRL